MKWKKRLLEIYRHSTMNITLHYEYYSEYYSWLKKFVEMVQISLHDSIETSCIC